MHCASVHFLRADLSLANFFQSIVSFTFASGVPHGLGRLRDPDAAVDGAALNAPSPTEGEGEYMVESTPPLLGVAWYEIELNFVCSKRI